MSPGRAARCPPVSRSRTTTPVGEHPLRSPPPPPRPTPSASLPRPGPPERGRRAPTPPAAAETGLARRSGTRRCASGPSRRRRRPSLTKASSAGRGAEARGDRPTRPVPRAQGGDVLRRLVEQRNLRVAKPVDGLLAVADDEHRRRQWARRRGLRQRPTPRRAATPVPTAGGWCPETRPRARGGTATPGGIGCGRTRPSAEAGAPRRSSVPVKSSTPSSSIART